MIISGLRLGLKQIERIYRNGIIIWESGKQYTMGQLMAALTGYAMAEVDTPVAIQMGASASLKSSATPEARDVVSGLSASGKLVGIAMPQPADTVERAGKVAMALRMCGRPTAGDMIFTRGQVGSVLTMEGRPWPANTLERAGATAASLKMLASPEAQGMTNILAAAKGEQSGYLLPKTQEMEKLVAGASGKLSMAALAFAKTLWDVAFSVNGVTEHETQVLDGEAVDDPVAAGIIEEPYRENTPQYIYDYAGWALSEDGEVVGGGGSAETVILAEQPISGFTSDTGAGAQALPLVSGETYKVLWDGAEYICKAYTVNMPIDEATLPFVFIGNQAFVEWSVNGEVGNPPDAIEPFAINKVPAQLVDGIEGILAFSCAGQMLGTCESDTHTVAIYQVVEAESEGLPAITADTVFYAVFKATLRTYAANFYVDGVLQSSQQVPYGEAATPPELTGEAGMILEWAPNNFTITDDTDFCGTWVRDYTITEQDVAFTDKTSDCGAYSAAVTGVKGLVSGNTYVVEWDGVAYPVAARDISGKTQYFDSTLHNAIGNAKILTKVWGLAFTTTEAATSEPFLMYGDATSITICTSSTAATHKVCVYAA